ncbi:MAG: hypothetical protein Q9172_000900 [Xanthocarpia lactea]
MRSSPLRWSTLALLADAEKLPDDIFDDHAGRQSLQRQISGLKNATTTPFERVAELCFQVRDRDNGLRE